ncbi:uncharacterized protein N7515_005013 [Penicillium bovifimosum]|uniref:Uncharacterized protein n=1 Tax=Penicillium bovifimosum TaxID=126998 RepID=A0A9W9L2Y5_9EURO|nr:uncharacterized protein N7515_005013 [Penicillium bovifimosum]KAJ5135735.1 hypothetical protein N7515_005013 [Penicillium bovifimosum]
MTPIVLELVAPPIHHFNSRSYELRDISPLTGHVIVSSPVSLRPNPTRIDVKLIQIVTYTGDSTQTRRLSGSTSESIKTRSFSERVVQEDHLPIPSREKMGISTWGNISAFRFSFDISRNTPPTSETPIGSITYAIEVTAATRDFGTITHRKSVKLSCHNIRVDSEKTPHQLYFPASNDIHGMTLTQNSTPRSGPRISFTATIHTLWKTAPASRPSELRCLVVRKLMWQAEEVVKIMSKPVNSNGKYSICERQLVRTLCDGSVKGSWGSEQEPYFGDGQSSEGGGEEKPASICIPFGFTIPTRAKVTDDIDLAAYDVDANRLEDSSCYQLPRGPSLPSTDAMMMAIVVHHRLKLEFVVGEDVFHRDTGKLVERKRSRTVLCPAVPLSVCEVSN